jgi:hypothetical protein
MRRSWIVRLFGILLFLLIAIAGFGEAVLQLWNLLMPAIFGLKPIGFWQAVGLLALSWILFGGWRGFPRGRGRHWKDRMTSEERVRFVQGMRHRCNPGAAPAAEAKS